VSSAIEQFASSFSFSSFGKAQDLHRRLWFTLIALLVFRFGTYVPLPGIDVHNLQGLLQQHAGGLLDIFNLFSGGSLQRGAIFSLGVAPYISAAIIIQLMSYMDPRMEALRKKEGEAGRRKLNQYTRYLTILLAAIQAYGLAVGLESMHSPAGSIVAHPGVFFRITTIITIMGASVLIMWLGEQITARGVGSGHSLLICVGIIAGLPQAMGSVLALGREGALSPLVILGILAMVAGIIAFVVFIELSQRRIVLQYPKRMVGNRMSAASSSHMPLKLNMSGVMGPIFASALMSVPIGIIGFTGMGKDSDFVVNLTNYLQTGHPVHMFLYGGLIIFFAFYWISLQFNPDELAENLRKNGSFVPGYRPGQATADYLDYVATRITTLGAAYLVFVCLLPEVLISKFSLPFYFGGTSLLIVVTVVMDTVTQVQSHLFAHHYEGTSLFKKARKREERK
jgi:preprotein translocase subunit SecY